MVSPQLRKKAGNAKDEIKRIAGSNPFEAERILALCAGKIEDGDNWHDVRRLDSCVIDASEVIRRITFCQDTDNHARGFRVARLKRCGHLWAILKTNNRLPPALADLKEGFPPRMVPGLPTSECYSGHNGEARDCDLYGRGGQSIRRLSPPPRGLLNSFIEDVPILRKAGQQDSAWLSGFVRIRKLLFAIRIAIPRSIRRVTAPSSI